MSVKTFIASRVAARLTDPARRDAERARWEAARKRAGAPHVVEYFHEVGDPYSCLTAQILAPFTARYDVTVTPRLVSPPPDWAAPERAQLIAYSRRDAALLAAKAGLHYVDPGAQPDRARLAAAAAALAEALADGNFVARAASIETALWSGAPLPSAGRDPAPDLAAGDARRAALGHYLSAMFQYGGEWYWGLDRLHHLEARLTELGARRDKAGGQVQTDALFAPPNLRQPPASAGPRLHPLEFFLSFRSPYTYLAAARVAELARAYQAPLDLRYVLPMVMRGLPVPKAKRGYIVADTAREARWLGVPFGRIADPLGRPVERGYGVLRWAIEEGRGLEFVLSFLKGVWSEGVDAGSDRELARLVERAGLDWPQARLAMADPAWRAQAEENRLAMTGLGLWGVPSFRYGETAIWGQDRLWVIEDAMARELESQR